MHSVPSLASFVVGALATWRVTHLLANEDGPWDCIVRLRELLSGTEAARLLDCFYCLSVCVAVPFACAISALWLDRAIVALALSGAAILLERCTASPPPPALWRVEQDRPPNSTRNE